MADVMHGSRLALPVSLELRALPSRAMAYASPLIALALTLVFGLLLFALLGKDPVAGVRVFLIEPLATKRAIGEVLLKTVPLVLCALGLSVCYRANVWNIGAEGQLIVGGIFAAATIIHFDTPTPAIPGGAALLLAVVAGLAGGMLWAGLTALLRDRFHANEILVSLMLTYIAQLLLLYMVNGPLKDPNGMNFPQSMVFDSAFVLPTLVAGTRLHVGFLFMLAMAAGHQRFGHGAGVFHHLFLVGLERG
ncbi:ABC transporter permease, partial [Ralstonia pseudosolanacearum]|uniref:ABC transporter permease n=1 Tax=Ralstonia pseudosolanacearum TaxID=1310165 RepID=UPI003D168486